MALPHLPGYLFDMLCLLNWWQEHGSLSRGTIPQIFCCLCYPHGTEPTEGVWAKADHTTSIPPLLSLQLVHCRLQRAPTGFPTTDGRDLRLPGTWTNGQSPGARSGLILPVCSLTYCTCFCFPLLLSSSCPGLYVIVIGAWLIGTRYLSDAWKTTLNDLQSKRWMRRERLVNLFETRIHELVQQPAELVIKGLK